MIDIKHIKHQDIDFKKWDNTILGSLYPLVFAQSTYLNATFPTWDALVIGDYESVFPLTAKVKFGIPYLHQPSFTPQLGVYGKITLEIEQAFFDYIKARYKLIEIELNASNNLQTQFHSIKNTYVIDYRKEFKANQNTKRNCAKAIKHGLIIQEVEAKQILSLSKEYLDGFLEQDLKLSKPTVHIFHQLLKSGIEYDLLKTFKTVNSAGDVIAIAHFMSNGKHVVYLKGTNSDTEEHMGSMHLLMQTAINYYKDKAVLFDFGGGTAPGLANFYNGFGAEPLSYSVLKINTLPRLVNFIKGRI